MLFAYVQDLNPLGNRVASTLVAALPVVQAHGFSPLTIAIVLGLLIGNTVYPRIASYAGAGIGYSRQTILRTGVVLYGFRLTLQQVASVGWAGVLVDAVVVVMTVVIAYQAGTRWLKLSRTESLLVGAGSAICGAAAVLATEPVVRGKAEQVSVAVAGVAVFVLMPRLFSGIDLINRDVSDVRNAIAFEHAPHPL